MVDGVGTTHHVRIGNDYHLILPGTYRKMNAPLFGPRFTTGDPDYNMLSFWQHWVQSCWIGGIGATEWQDDSMFDEGVGVNTSQHEVMVLSRDLGPNASRTINNYALGNEAFPSTQFQFRKFLVFNAKLYCLEPDDSGNTGWLWRYNDATDDWTLVKTFATYVASFAEFGSYLIFGSEGTTMDRMDTAEVFTTIAKPAGYSDVTWSMKAYGDRLYVDFRGRWWRLKPDHTWDGSTLFFETTGVHRYAVAHEVHAGYLYVATWNGRIYRTDGNNTFEMWAFPSGTYVYGLKSYDGRLFVSTSEPVAGTNASEGALYQFSGSSVTQLKRWGLTSTDIDLGGMCVAFGKLYYGGSNLLGMDTGFGIAVYDVAEDAHSIFASNQDSVTYAAGTEGLNFMVSDVFWYKGYLWCAVAGHGVFKTKVVYRDLERELATYDTTAAGAVVGSLNGGWLTSSDFDAGTPGLRKLWNAITIEADLPSTACSVFVEVSVDKGVTWHIAGTVSKTGTTTRYSTTLKLLTAANGVLQGPRLKYRLTLRSTDTTKTPAVRAVNVQYLPQPEPNWQWQMTLVLSDKQQLLDWTTQQPGVAAKLAALQTTYRNQIPVYFQDIDGVKWVDEAGVALPGVLMTAFDARVRHIGPTSDGAIEAEVSITLIESAEVYPV